MQLQHLVKKWRNYSILRNYNENDETAVFCRNWEKTGTASWEIELVARRRIYR